MTRLALTALIVFVAVLFIAVAIYCGNTPNSFPESSLNVSVTDFNLTGYYNPVGVVWNDMFNLSYANNGAVEVNNVTIAFSTNSTYEIDRPIGVFDPAPPQGCGGEYKMDAEIPLGNIKANETRDFTGCIWNYLGDTSKVHGFAFTATLQSNGTILDQATVMIPPLV